MALATVLFASVLWMTLAGAEPLSIGLPGARAFPESITSTSDGTLFVGRLGEGGIVRADLPTGAAKRNVPLPGPNAFCNDIAVDASGAVYVTDSAGPNVLRLPAGASTFEVFASNPQ